MKYSNLKFILFACLFIGLVSTACKNKSADATDATEAAIDKTSPEYASAFICPMHCKGSGSHEAGECPVCGMDYEKNENYVPVEGETHSHDEAEAHDHGHGHGDEEHEHEHSHDDEHNHKHDKRENK